MSLQYRRPLLTAIVWGLCKSGSFANAFKFFDSLGTTEEGYYGLVTAALTVYFAEHLTVTTMVEDSKISSMTSLQILPPSPTVRITESINTSRWTDSVSTVSTAVPDLPSYTSTKSSLSKQISALVSRSSNLELCSTNWTTITTTQTATTPCTTSPDQTNPSITTETVTTSWNCRCTGTTQTAPSITPIASNGTTMIMLTPQTTCFDYNHSRMQGSAAVNDLYFLFGIAIPFWITWLMAVL